jgi:hypothetical protein
MREFESARTRDAGYRSASQNESDPQPRAEHELEELGRQLVVLFVRLLDLCRDRRAAELVDEGALTTVTAPAFHAQAPGAVDANGAPQHPVRHVLDHDAALRGNQGTKTLVSRWYRR